MLGHRGRMNFLCGSSSFGHSLRRRPRRPRPHHEILTVKLPMLRGSAAVAGLAGTSAAAILVFLTMNRKDEDFEMRETGHKEETKGYVPNHHRLYRYLLPRAPTFCQMEEASAAAGAAGPPETNHSQMLSSSSSSSSSSTMSAVVENDEPFMLFLGTGSSTGCPKPLCTMMFGSHRRISSTNSASTSTSALTSEMCRVSTMAIQGDNPKNNKNYRNNPSFLIHHYDSKSKSYKNIVIDTGKTFRETALRWFPAYGIQSLDALILTHHHMDAVGGLDDVRGFQSVLPPPNGKHDTASGGGPPKRVPIPIYMSPFCHENLKRQFPWLFPSPEITMPVQHHHQPNYFSTDETCSCREDSADRRHHRHSPSTSMPLAPVPVAPTAVASGGDGGGTKVIQRDVASFHVTLFEDLSEHTIPSAGDFKFVPLPVWHGDDLLSHGFAFSLVPPPPSRTTTKIDVQAGTTEVQQQQPLHVVYLSDISRMVPETLEYIQKQLPPTDILIIDSLLWHKTHPVHYSLDQAVELATKHIRPKHATYLIGMSCDQFFPHDEMNQYLIQAHRKNGNGSDYHNEDGRYRPIIQFAFDGQPLYLPTETWTHEEKPQ